MIVQHCYVISDYLSAGIGAPLPAQDGNRVQSMGAGLTGSAIAPLRCWSGADVRAARAGLRSAPEDVNGRAVAALTDEERLSCGPASQPARSVGDGITAR